MHRTIGRTLCVLLQGDITTQDVDAIVNAANSGLLGGGGVDGAIHRAGGPAILEECRAIRSWRGPLPTGQAVATTAGNLPARIVIHAVGPVWKGGENGEDGLLRAAYRNSLLLAREKGAASIAFPAISTGVYGFPKERAAKIAFESIRTFVREHPEIKEIRFVAFSQSDHDAFVPLFDVTRPDPLEDTARF
jgi:O-acetyl-ADP-ribose deacetylase (regulator of RNase III)